MDDIRTIKRDLKEIKSILMSIEEPVTEKEAAKFLGISVKTLQNYKDSKVLGTYIVNILGQRMYYKSRLLGLKIGANVDQNSNTLSK